MRAAGVRMFWKIGLPLALLAPGSAHAQDWRIASLGNEDKSVVMVDIASIVTDTEFPRADVMLVMSEDSNGTAAVFVNMEFDCAGARRHGRSAIMYDLKGGVRGRAGVEGQWNVIPQHTIYTGVKDLVCRGGARPTEPSFGKIVPISAARDFLVRRGKESAEQRRREKETEGEDPLAIKL